jgi:pilus assembly protein CpaF
MRRFALIPDIIVVGEMRGAEANAAQEAARTGVAVVTTIHSNSCEATYRRMVSLCKRAVDTPDQTLMDYVTEAYPIVVFCKQLENKQRRMMEIQECEILPDGSRRFRPLFQYIITENRMEDGKLSLRDTMNRSTPFRTASPSGCLKTGCPRPLIERLQGKEAAIA